MKRYGVVVLAAAAIVGGACQGAEGAPGEDRGAPPAVVLGPRDVARVTRADLVAGVPVSGTLMPAVDVRITAPISEVLEAVSVKEGQRVARGQVLARFRTDVVRAAALSAEAQREVAAADYARMQNLLTEGAVAERDVEAALVTLRAAEATEALARQRLAEMAVRAPTSGVITERHVQAGDRVQDGDPLFQLANISELEFEATVPSEHVEHVRPGASVALALSGFPAVSGRVARVNATVDPATRQLRAYVTVPNRDRRLVGGLYASGRVVIAQGRGVLAMPRAALRTDGDGATYALVVEGDTLARRTVTPGLADEVADLIEIRAGLAEGAMVVVGPAEGLGPGQRIELAGREG